ncbi:hypothetical protein SAMN04487783_1199 [Agrococcus baldri]|uniref:Uncharacterized protein n=1 Tax=Agrococcus baldri TaxID=153730 RepID=A0AA94HM92_9MICO|nr:hypothetical protein [Agrococcus baldri]SFS09026.1 hypothetical protein SAMN04487783_1199 [Agrococcus baldri]
MQHDPRSGARERGPIMHRTAPEAAPMVAGRATGWGSRRNAAVGIGMLVLGLIAALAALIALGTRIFPAFVAARETGGDAATYFFMGTAGSVGELVLVIALIVLVPVAVVVAWLGYRRVTDDGPSLAGVHQANSPNAVLNNIGAGSGY